MRVKSVVMITLFLLNSSKLIAGLGNTHVRNSVSSKLSSELGMLSKKNDKLSFVLISKNKLNFKVSKSKYDSNIEDEKKPWWNSFKDGVYSAFDTVSCLTKKKHFNAIKNRKIATSYSDTVERKKSNIPSDTPVSDVMAKYKFSLKSITSPMPNHDASSGENFFLTGRRKAFNTVKDSIYDAFDGIFRRRNTIHSSNKKLPVSIIDFKAPTKVSENLDVPVQILTAQLDNLESPNLWKRFQAKLAISAAEKKIAQRLEEEKRRDDIQNVKETVYGIIDVIKKAPKRTEDFVTQTINQIETTVKETQRIPEKVITLTRVTVENAQLTVKEIKRTPAKISQAVDDTIASIENTKKTIDNAVREVQSIPQKIETKVAETQKSFAETKQSVEHIYKRVEDLAFQAKVLVGVEKPKPKPPPPPPPPKTAAAIALDAGLGLAKVTVKLTWSLGKGAVGLGVSAVRLAWSKIGPNTSAQASGSKIPIAFETNQQPNLVKEMTEDLEILAAPTLADIDPLLNSKIADALKSAEAAVKSKKKNNPENIGVLTIEINEAVQRAKEAAEIAKRDADELEALVKERITSN